MRDSPTISVLGLPVDQAKTFSELCYQAEVPAANSPSFPPVPTSVNLHLSLKAFPAKSSSSLSFTFYTSNHILASCLLKTWTDTRVLTIFDALLYSIQESDCQVPKWRQKQNYFVGILTGITLDGFIHCRTDSSKIQSLCMNLVSLATYLGFL